MGGDKRSNTTNDWEKLYNLCSVVDDQAGEKAARRSVTYGAVMPLR